MTPWLITLFTVTTVYLLDKWDNRYLRAFFNWVPAILLAYLIPAGISALTGQDHSSAGIHQYSRYFFIPMAIVAVMSSLSIRQLVAIGWKPIAVFAAGSAWIALFPALTVFFLPESRLITEVLTAQEFWKGLPPVVGGWIGGSTSQLVLKELVACPEHIFLTILVLDNVLVNIWTILMFQGIKESDWLNRRLRITNLTMPPDPPERSGRVMHPLLCLALLLGSVGVTHLLALPFVAQIIALSVIGLLLSNLIPTWNFDFVLKLGGLLILTVMAILGLKLKFGLVQFEAVLLVFLIIWLISHFFLMLGAAKALNLNTAWVPIASMANVGGIATAPAVTAAYEKRWMPHAILLAILSMATGTFWGMGTIVLLRWLLGG